MSIVTLHCTFLHHASDFSLSTAVYALVDEDIVDEFVRGVNDTTYDPIIQHQLLKVSELEMELIDIEVELDTENVMPHFKVEKDPSTGAFMVSIITQQ